MAIVEPIATVTATSKLDSFDRDRSPTIRREAITPRSAPIDSPLGGMTPVRTGYTTCMATTKKTAAKKSTAKKSTAKKTAKKASSATKATAKKAASATKSTAKKASAASKAAKRTVAKKAPATKKSTAKKTSASKKGSTTAATRDALALLKADHQRVSDLFDKFEGLGDRAHKTREATVHTIIEELSVHAGIEETVFYPALRERIAADDEDQVLEALEEHHIVKFLLSELQSLPSEDERYTAKVTVLRELVDHHVEEEESEMFKQARGAFSRTELADLGDELAAARSSAPKRAHPEAPDTPPGNVIANVITAPLDAATGIGSRASEAIHSLVE